MPATKHNAETLAAEFWSRRRDGELSVRLTAKQVSWLVSLLHAMAKMPSHSRVYTVPTNGTPIELVIYPNGAGFIRVEQFATECVDGKWRIKPQWNKG